MQADHPSDTASAPASATERVRVRWYRRRPPAGLGRSDRIVWWCGHAQLFLAAALLPIGLVLVLPARPIEAPFAVVLVGLAMIALAGPVAISGRLLRAAPRGLAGLHGGWRVVALVAWVLATALVATVAVAACVPAAAYGWLWIGNGIRF
ncbi:hypothetical protein GCM10009819_22770 [Agromyces tropicus]|uniref:Uncharacterized protein n=1 Tax=Agromyces tropicus TaxID=555371 RepID=A0ABN2UJ49_9MICO